MYEDNTIGVVIPAYNEEGFVGTVIETLPAFVDQAFVVDDCSTDNTWEEILGTKDRLETEVVADGGVGDEFVVAIQHDENRGVGGAIKTGYLSALDADMDVTAVMGGDGQMNPGELERVVEPVAAGRADYVKGNRLLPEANSDEMPRFRYIGNLILTGLTRIASGYWSVGDSQMGYTAISQDALEAVDIDAMFEFYGYCNDLLVRLSVADKRVVDVPVKATYGDEESDIEYSSYIPKVSLMLLRMFLWRMVTKRDTVRENMRSGLFIGGILTTILGLWWAVRAPKRLVVVVLGVLSVLGGMGIDAVTNRDLNGRDTRDQPAHGNSNE